MGKKSDTPPPPGGQFLVYRTEDGKLKIDVRFEGETVWLTQQIETFSPTKPTTRSLLFPKMLVRISPDDIREEH